ncbi:MAG: class I SAM-dependent methyltransferase [Candidatus Peregrinibacteria bacterium]
MSPLPTVEEDMLFYREDKQLTNLITHAEYADLRKRDREDTLRRIAWLKAKYPPSASTRLLDVGCGYGFFVDAAAEAGYSAEGIDLNTPSIAIARAHGNNLYIEGVVNDDFATRNRGSYDIVTTFHVLEHLTDPVAYLRRLGLLVKQGGLLVVEVPNADDALLAHNPAYNAFYWQRAHLSYFTPMTLRVALRAAGFGQAEVESVQRYGMNNLFHWITHNAPQLHCPTFRTEHPLLQSLEQYYRQERERSLASDTLLAGILMA